MELSEVNSVLLQAFFNIKTELNKILHQLSMTNADIKIDVKKEETIQGFKITCAGRLGGAEMARVESKRFGQTSLHTFFQKIEYASVCAYTPYGLIGVKVWVSYKPNT